MALQVVNKHKEELLKLKDASDAVSLLNSFMEQVTTCDTRFSALDSSQQPLNEPAVWQYLFRVLALNINVLINSKFLL